MEVDQKVKEGPNRARKPMSDAQKEKIRQTLRRNREKNKAVAEERKQAREAAEQADAGEFLQGHIPAMPVSQPAIDVKTGMSRDEAEELQRELKLKAAERKIEEAAISADNRLMVHQEIKVDSLNTLRRYVELTPSMCRSRNCPFDSAKEAGATAWGNAPVDQPMSDGKTFGERLIALREYHEATAHTAQQMNDHIITADELNKRTWGIGQDIRGDFLTGAR